MPKMLSFPTQYINRIMAQRQRKEQAENKERAYLERSASASELNKPVGTSSVADASIDNAQASSSAVIGFNDKDDVGESADFSQERGAGTGQMVNEHESSTLELTRQKTAPNPSLQIKDLKLQNDHKN